MSEKLSSPGRHRGILGALRRLTSTNAELRDEDLQRDAEAVGAQSVVNCGDREMVTLRGTIQSITMPPRDASRRVVCQMVDGSGEVTLIWMGRRTIPGIEAGTTLLVEGRICCRDGERLMYNPRYQLLGVPRSA